MEFTLSVFELENDVDTQFGVALPCKHNCPCESSVIIADGIVLVSSLVLEICFLLDCCVSAIVLCFKLYVILSSMY